MELTKFRKRFVNRCERLLNKDDAENGILP